MDPDISFTKEAFNILTADQMQAIKRLITEGTKIKVMVDFSLPTGYVYFLRANNGDLYSSPTTLHGGIDPEGVVST